jgi:hypothetical protein
MFRTANRWAKFPASSNYSGLRLKAASALREWVSLARLLPARFRQAESQCFPAALPVTLVVLRGALAG